MPFKNGTKLCICEICNCGRHKCPHRAAHRGPLGECSLSEYTNQYVPHRIDMIPSCKPAPQAIKGDGPLSDKTTHRLDYVPHALERPFVHQPDSYKVPEGEFESTTMYKKDYTEKHAPRVPPAKRDDSRKVPGRFEGEPTYRSDYRKWDMPPLERGGKALEWVPSKDPFEGLATYTSDYVPHRLAATTSCKPEQAAMQSNTPFDGLTDYRQSYVPHQIESKKAKEKAMWSRPTAPFEGISTFARDFTPKEGGRLQSCKPSAQAFSSGAPLNSDTTHRIDYKPWEMERPFHHQPDAYRRPEGDMDMNTTYVRDYPQHPMAKQGMMRPKERGRNVGPFEGITDYRDNFRKWDIARRKHMGPNNEYVGPNVPFEGQSTHQAHFIPHPMDMRRSFKPDARANLSDAPFDDGTIYRMEYTPKHVEPCPAAILDGRSSAFIYREQDDTGHKYYEPMTTTVTDLRSGQTVRSSRNVPVAAVA